MAKPTQTLDITGKLFQYAQKKRNSEKGQQVRASEVLANPDDETELELANEEEPESCAEPWERVCQCH